MTKTLGLNFHLIIFNRQNWRKLTVNRQSHHPIENGSQSRSGNINLVSHELHHIPVQLRGRCDQL